MKHYLKLLINPQADDHKHIHQHLDILPRNEEEYLKMRVADQIRWYDKKSATNKNSFLSLKITEIVLALTIPLLSGYMETQSVIAKIVGVLGLIVATIAGLITLLKYQENWIEYRTVAESLKLEKFLFLAKAGPYKESKASFPLFAERFESLISNSTKKWTSYVSTKTDNENN